MPKQNPITVTAETGVTTTESLLIDAPATEDQPAAPVSYLPGAEPDRATTEIDGYVIDIDTGEVLGFALAPLGNSQFEVKDVESAEWVMRKMLEAQSAMGAVDQTPDVILARNIIAAAEGLKKPHANKLAWLEGRFGRDIEGVAKANLPAKGKTWRSLYGSVSFRAVKAKLEIVAQLRAAKWLAKNAASAIRVTADLDALTEDDRLFISSLVEEEAVGVEAQIMKTKLPADLLVRAANTPDFEVETGIAYVAERESATITIGAKN